MTPEFQAIARQQFDEEAFRKSIDEALRLLAPDLRLNWAEFANFPGSRSHALTPEPPDEVMVHAFIRRHNEWPPSLCPYRRWIVDDGPPCPPREMGYFLAGLAAGIHDERSQKEAADHGH